MATTPATGPLAGIRVLEFDGLGPLPFAAMLLADMGASIIRITRPKADWPTLPFVSRGRASVALDLRREEDRDRLTALVARADVLLEGYRPGVMEKFGFGPAETMEHNPRLIYGRMTGWGQDGPRSRTAGHDINYLAVSGVLAAITPPGEAPRPPLNLLGDYGGGSLWLVTGVLAALVERQRSGKGQIVDAAIVDGALSMMTNIQAMEAVGLNPAGDGGLFNGGKPYYRTYRCSDGKYVAVGGLEEKFRREMTDRMGLPPGSVDGEDGAARLAQEFARHPRDHWSALFDGSDACVSPVLGPQEVRNDPHMRERQTAGANEGTNGGTGAHADDTWQPSPAPRFSRSGSMAADDVPVEAALALWGIEA